MFCGLSATIPYLNFSNACDREIYAGIARAIKHATKVDGKKRNWLYTSLRWCLISNHTSVTIYTHVLQKKLTYFGTSRVLVNFSPPLLMCQLIYAFFCLSRFLAWCGKVYFCLFIGQCDNFCIYRTCHNLLRNCLKFVNSNSSSD